jgi:hypothetical protein
MRATVHNREAKVAPLWLLSQKSGSAIPGAGRMGRSPPYQESIRIASELPIHNLALIELTSIRPQNFSFATMKPIWGSSME